MANAKRKNREETKRRYEAIKDLMTSFVMSTVAVVAVVVLVPASPKAEFTKVVALENEIVYQVEVTDEENALDLSSLTVVLENQLAYFEHPINLGQQSGYFENLQSNTQYRLSVYGNKGFGQERLNTVLVTTKGRVGGTILGVLVDSVDFDTNYYVDVSVNDPEGIYSSVTLYYGYRMHSETEINYSSVDVVDPRATIELLDVFTSSEFHIYLEGITVDGPELLDEIWVTPPFTLYTSVYQSFLSNTEVGFSIYSDMTVEEITYTMNVYKDNNLVQTKSFTPDNQQHGDSEFIVDGLSPDTTYVFECIADYTNPHTLRSEQVNVYDEEITTLGDYSYTYTIDTVGDYIEVTITLIDPNHYFQLAYYEAYDTSDEFAYWLAEESFGFTPIGDSKTTTFSILIPQVDSYRITIGVRSQTTYTIKQIIEVIQYE